MAIEEILKALAHKDNKFPREALEQAIAQKDEITPHLLKILERVADRPEEFIRTGSKIDLYALYLLAQFREQRACPLVVRIASLPSKTVSDLLVDTKTEGLPQILASVCGGDTSLIKQLVENRDADEFVRDSALRSLLALVVSGDVSREEVMSYFASLFDGKLEKEPSAVWDGLVCSATDLYPEEVYDKIKKAYAEGLVHTGVVSLDDVDRDLALGKEAALARLRGDEHLHLVENVIEEMEWWACYEEPDRRAKRSEKNFPAFSALFEKGSFDPRIGEKSTASIKPTIKVGRNDPCPCGSGKKYKKCCGA
jgi:hypothetical protein